MFLKFCLLSCLVRFYSVVAPGDTVNVIGEFDDEGKCDIDRDSNFIIVHPDILLSGTRVNYLLLKYCMYMFSYEAIFVVALLLVATPKHCYEDIS